jgi:hypothetical protein
MMHYDIPTYPFVASVRIHSRGTTPNRTRANTMHSEWSEAGSVTPGSFPPTPESRATCISRSFDRTDNVVFNARDKLRMEALASDEKICEGARRSAFKMLLGGKFGTFDMQHSSPLLKLSYGDHCVSRLPNQSTRITFAPPVSGASDERGAAVPTVCSTRASLSVRRNVYVYVEFLLRTVKNSSSTRVPLTSCSDRPSSVSSSPDENTSTDVATAAAASVPAVCGLFSVGLAAGDFQLEGAEVGCSERSVGLSSTGCLSVCAGPAEDDVSTFQLQAVVGSGDRLGMLLFLPGVNYSEMSSRAASARCSPSIAPAVGTVAPPCPPRPASRMDSSGSASTGYWDTDLSMSLDEGTGANIHAHEAKGVSMCFNVNGCVIPIPMLAQYDISDVSWDSSEDVFPVLSLQADNIAVWAGFSVDDVKYRSRDEIGAPFGEVIYCLDGSVLIDAAN